MYGFWTCWWYSASPSLVGPPSFTVRTSNVDNPSQRVLSTEFPGLPHGSFAGFGGTNNMLGIRFYCQQGSWTIDQGNLTGNNPGSTNGYGKLLPLHSNTSTRGSADVYNYLYCDGHVEFQNVRDSIGTSALAKLGSLNKNWANDMSNNGNITIGPWTRENN
jgi:prepilin-type processing-associated H-X9-DG protein